MTGSLCWAMHGAILALLGVVTALLKVEMARMRIDHKDQLRAARLLGRSEVQPPQPARRPSGNL